MVIEYRCGVDCFICGDIGEVLVCIGVEVVWFLGDYDDVCV